jgi:hypothetical protein
MPSETVQQVIQSIREQRERFERFCRSLSEAELMRPVPGSTWLVKDFVSHLGSLDPVMAISFQAAAAGRPDEVFHTEESEAFKDIDAWNDARVAERRGWPLERVLEEAAHNRAELIKVLEGLTDEDLARLLHFTGDNKRSAATLPLRVFMLGWSLHDPIHTADMLKALPERAEDPEMKAWVEHPVVKGYQQAMAGPPRPSTGSG